MIEFNCFHDKIVKFYRYRTALLRNWALKVHLDENDFRDICDMVEHAGHRMDNHVCFSTEVCNFWYSDGWLYIGGEIKEGGY